MLKIFLLERLSLSSLVLCASFTAGIVLVYSAATWENVGSCEQLAFASNQNGNWEIYLLDVQSKLTINLTNSRTDEDYPFWSTDGRQIAYTVTYMNSSLLEIGIQTMETGNTQYYAYPSTPYGNAPRFSSYNPGIINAPEPRPLLYVSVQGTTTHLMLRNRDGEHQIASREGYIFAPNLSPEFTLRRLYRRSYR